MLYRRAKDTRNSRKEQYLTIPIRNKEESSTEEEEYMESSRIYTKGVISEGEETEGDFDKRRVAKIGLREKRMGKRGIR